VKETIENTNKWKNIPCLGIKFKCPSYPKWSTYSMQFLSKYQCHSSQKYEKNPEI
jgi:hypothetical protein